MGKVAKKTWPWPGLPGFTRPHFPGKLGKKPESPTRPVFARLAGFLTGLLMQGFCRLFTTGKKIKLFKHWTINKYETSS